MLQMELDWRINGKDRIMGDRKCGSPCPPAQAMRLGNAVVVVYAILRAFQGGNHASVRL